MRPSLTFLGLIKRAGKLTIGDESVKKDARENRARLIITASDAGRSAQEHADNLARMAKCPRVAPPWTKQEIGHIVGRGTPGILAVTDANMAEALISKLEKEKSE